MTEESPSYLPQIQPEALRLADALKRKRILNVGQGNPLDQAADELLRLHAENQTLQAGYDAARLEIESLKARVQELEAALKKANAQAEQFERQWYLRGDEIEALHEHADALEAQLDAIGAGGVEPLRKPNAN